MSSTPSEHYGDFADPLGLANRMVQSQSAAARWAIGLAALRALATPIDRALEGREIRRMDGAGTDTGPLLLIVGAPRAGTTLAHQILTDVLDVSFFDNVSGLAARSPVTMSHLVDRRHRPLRDDYRSYYGNTAGLRSPNDGFAIWNRWLGASRYDVPDALSESTIADMRTFFAAWHASSGKPFVNKNNRNSACIELLADALPQARFVEIRRNRVDVARSLLRARATVQGDANRPWGLFSNRATEDGESPVDQVCRQVIAIEAALDAAAERVSADRHVRIDYAALCREPGREVRRLVEAFPCFGFRTDVDLNRLTSFANAAPPTPGPHDDEIRAAFDALEFAPTAREPCTGSDPLHRDPGEASQ